MMDDDAAVITRPFPLCCQLHAVFTFFVKITLTSVYPRDNSACKQMRKERPYPKIAIDMHRSLNLKLI